MSTGVKGNEFEALISAIAERIRTKVNGYMPAIVEWAKVKEVQEGNKTCTVTMDSDSGDQVVEDVLISFGSNIVSIPSVGSKCLVLHILNDKSIGMVIWSEKVDKVNINGDNLKGLAAAPEIAKRIKALEDELESFKTKFNAHSHAAHNTPTVSLTVPALLPRTTELDITNKKINHGDN
jgi:hypothetical protein